ncbi:DUF5811 family protein [Haladaptatus sp. QDMS2]|uniref:DUF5811 family protein n=1 Tax=Haladaptatus sp. QDMS2 TaxID=3033391 RepID=UPI0023E82FE7|nr:DUF5811 family protein [Haladaptatus sp. QDMS2]
MYGNTPYAGNDSTDRAAQPPALTPDQRRELRRGVVGVAARTREFLPDEYVIGTELTAGMDGTPHAFVAVHPPIGSPVSAGIAPDDGDFEREEGIISAEDREEVARSLAAQAALQVKQSLDSDVDATAR